MNIQKSINKIVRERERRKNKFTRFRKVLVLITTLFLGIFIGSFFLQSDFSITGFASGALPTVGGSSGSWGTVLNNYLEQEHTSTGGHKNVTVEGDLNVSGNLEVGGNGNFTGNLTIGDKITFRLGEVIDNIVDGIIQITGGLNITDVLILNPQINPTTSIEGSVFYNNSLNSIMVYNGSQWEVPGVKNEIKYFNGTTCPPGWIINSNAVGRYILGVNSTEFTLEASVGTALTNIQNRAVGQHTHTFTGTNIGQTGQILEFAAGTDFTISTDGNWRAFTPVPAGTNANSGSVTGTNAPYIQYLVCIKD